MKLTKTARGWKMEGEVPRKSVVSPSQDQPSSINHVLLGTWCVFTMEVLLDCVLGSFIFSNDKLLTFTRKLYQSFVYFVARCLILRVLHLS